jgi:hypothetical protein
MVTLSFQGEKGAKGDPGPMGLPVSPNCYVFVIKLFNIKSQLQNGTTIPTHFLSCTYAVTTDIAGHDLICTAN